MKIIDNSDVFVPQLSIKRFQRTTETAQHLRDAYPVSPMSSVSSKSRNRTTNNTRVTKNRVLSEMTERYGLPPKPKRLN
jgi:hypothetical protein